VTVTVSVVAASSYQAGSEIMIWWHSLIWLHAGIISVPQDSIIRIDHEIDANVLFAWQECLILLKHSLSQSAEPFSDTAVPDFPELPNLLIVLRVLRKKTFSKLSEVFIALSEVQVSKILL
jgi:hypothetical protein